MNGAPRNLVLPVVLSVWVITFLAAIYTCAMVPCFVDYYEFYAPSGGSFQHGAVARGFHCCYPAGVPIGLIIVGYGVRLLYQIESGAVHLAWYASVSISLAAIWLTWALLAERSLYVLLFPA